MQGAKQLDEHDVRALFPNAWWLEVFSYMKEPHPPVQFFDRSLSVSSLAAGDGPWAIIVHGDLHAETDLDFGTSDYKSSLLVVQGNVRCRNFRFTNGATCVVAHDLTASGYVIGRYGDENASLEVGGTLRARALLLDHVTGVQAGTLDALTYAAEGWGLPQDIEEDHFVPDVGGDMHAAWEAAIAGKPILRPEAEPELQALARLRASSR